MLSVSGLSRSYGEFKAVDDLSFTIGAGEIAGLLGHNGAGKTTIMKVISGYLEPDQGRITVDNIDLGASPKLVQQRLGYLPENLPLYPEMPVADYLDYAASLKGLQGELKTAEIRRVVEATTLTEKFLSPIAHLSRGYKQRVGVAQALLGKPHLLILDEPTNGLDPTQTEQMRQLIRDVSKHATVILSTHIMQEVEALCDRVLILKAGRLVVDARLAELQRTHALALVTDLAPDALQSALAQLQLRPTLTPHGSEGPWRHYELTLPESDDRHAFAATVAAAVTQAGGRLGELRGAVRNLETLFREVSEGKYGHGAGEVLNHAA
ncbi:MAG TPA: ABC transporter ATP-binding protein [Hyphomicrobiales bacterium]|nr:ABC transporter ATP-binding protein [Hyphomicrobiales bacterium]